MIFGLSSSDIKTKLDEGKLTISVYGLGRVGLPLAIAWLRKKQNVIGADIDKDTVNKINNGIPPITDEPHIPEAVKKFVKEGKFRATTNLVEASKDSEIKFIAVPTTLSGGFAKNPLESALQNIAKGLKEGDAISIECTVPPTTTERWARPLLEDESGFKNISLIRDSDPDTMAPLGIPCGPPDIRELDWDNIWKEINNLLVDRGLTNLQSLNIGGLENSILVPIKRRLLNAYKNKEKNNG